MLYKVTLLLSLCQLFQCNGNGLSPLNVDASLDCELRNLACQYAQLLPQCGSLKEIYDALQPHNFDINLTSGKLYKPRPFLYQSYKEGVVEIYVDAVNGNDDNAGDISHPLQSLVKAIELFGSQAMRFLTTIYLCKGTYYLEQTVILSPADSGLTIAGYKDEAPVISGGKLCKFSWKLYRSKLYPDLKLFVINLTEQSSLPFNQLFIDGYRVVCARYSNGNPETTGLHTDPTRYFSAAEQWYNEQLQVGTTIVIENPMGEEGGSVPVFNPLKSYWGTAKPVGGGGSIYEVPVRMQYPLNVSFIKRSWSDPSTGKLRTFQGKRWGGWIFQIDGWDEAGHNIAWSKGGFQEARGAPYGAEWYVDNIFDELYSPGEWFYDDKTIMLYFSQNGTSIVGATYGRKTMSGLLASQGIRVSEQRVGLSLARVNPANQQWRRDTTARHTNPIPYYAEYFGHKLHLDQNEKLVMYGATHICAVDGYSGKIVEFVTMPIKNNLEIYTHLYQPILSNFGLWDSLRIDKGKEWYLVLYIQEKLSGLRRNQNRHPHIQTSSKKNHPVERIWVEINSRVNYPIKNCLIRLEENNDISTECPFQKYLISWFTIRVANVGTRIAVAAWNNHRIPGPHRGIPNEKMEENNGTIKLQPSQIPKVTNAVKEYEELGGKLTVFTSYGIDQLQHRQDLIQERERLFTVRYPDFSIIFYSVVNGNTVLFRDGLLYLIRINSVLAQQLH